MKRNNFWHNVPRNAGDQPGGAPAPTPESTPAPEPASGPDLSFIPQDFHKDGAPDIGGFAAHYQELVARDAQRAERDAATPEAFSFSLPADMKYDGIDGLPEGFAVELTPDDPTLKPLYDGLGETLKAWAKDGIPATAGSDLMAMLARYQAVEYAESVKAMTADLGKLGADAQVEARVNSIGRALETRLPAEEATALKSLLRTSGAIKALERLLSPARGTSPAPATPPGIDVSNMTPAQMLAAANAMAR